MNNERTKPTLAEEFLTIYNELDVYMRKQLRCGEGIAHMYMIDRMSEKNPAFRNFRDELKEYARLRNAIIHNPFMREADPIAEPHFEVVRHYGILKERILNPPRAVLLAVPAEKIYSTRLEANALEVIKVMSQKIYSYVPVLDENKRIAGVFSENVVFSYLAKNMACAIDQNTKISVFEDLIPVEKHSSEYFEFAHKKAMLSEVKELFERGLTERKRLGVVYITDNGRQNGVIVGMITAWDIAGSEKISI